MGFIDFIRKPKLPKGITSKPFTCKRDGLMIGGTEYRPAGENLPIAIVCHGFMAWQDTVRHYTQFLAEMGYAAYCFDFNGGSVMKSQSEGKTTEMSVLTEVKDLEAVIEYLRTLPYVNPNKINCGPMKVGRCYATDVRDIDPFEKIKAYTGQVLITHGTADKIVNISYAERAVEAYKSTKPENMSMDKRIRYYSIEDGAHMYSKKHDVIAMEYLKAFA